ncbi:MAG: stage II sporulation protein M [Methanobrevibacter thaueri]|nr:stage II sporulation protein M [Methanobrevibacter thaueri]
MTNIKKLIAETITDNKKLIIGLYALFIITFIISWIINTPRIEDITRNVTSLNTPGEGISAFEILINNELSGAIVYLGSILFGIMAFISILFNGYTIGGLGPLFAKIIPNGGILYIIYLIPHGIFEFTGMVFESAGGILLFLFLWRFIKTLRNNSNSASDAFDMTKKILIQSLILYVIAVILNLIAAPIEAYFSTSFSQFIMSIFGLM